MEKILIHYHEIALKGKNRNFFENKLVENIKKSANSNNLAIKSIKNRRNVIVCEFYPENKEKIDFAIKNIFGVKYFSHAEEIKKDVVAIKKRISEILSELTSKKIQKIAFKTKRSDKQFPLTSPEINKELGEIANRLGIKVDYKNAVKKIFIEINHENCYIYSEKIEGYGGLPVASSGKVLCLLSGGIDSPVASWLMMKRGCQVDFLHIHSFKTNEEAIKGKIKKLAETLNNFQFKSKIYLIPYNIYELHAIDKKIKDDLVLFRNYLFKIAEKISEKEGYLGIVTGDNLGQVASQTLENINSSEQNTDIPIFRPLLSYNKEEIINLSEKIGTYEASIEEYKDCCSILAKNPKTKTNSEYFKKILEKSEMDELVDKSFKNIEAFDI